MSHRSGFTLVELSIVLVIIGLIIGGVLVGKDLIKAAELKTIISDKEKYISAINTFRTKYGEPPGDMKQATAVWGAVGGNASDNYTDSCYATFSPDEKSLTCNGNGDGKIANCGGTQFWELLCSNYENTLIWEQLANAKLIQGAYYFYHNPNLPVGRGPILTVGLNIPASRISADAGWSLLYVNSSDTFFPPGVYGNTLFYGGGSPDNNGDYRDMPLYSTLTTLDAFNIDSKIDDGKPGTGTVSALPKSNGLSDVFTPNCSTSSTASTAIYNLTAAGPQCSLIFSKIF